MLEMVTVYSWVTLTKILALVVDSTATLSFLLACLTLTLLLCAAYPTGSHAFIVQPRPWHRGVLPVQERMCVFCHTAETAFVDHLHPPCIFTAHLHGKHDHFLCFIPEKIEAMLYARVHDSGHVQQAVWWCSQWRRASWR